MFADFMKSMRKEWERTLLGVMLIIGLVGFIAGSLQFMALFRGEKVPPPPKVRVKEKYGANSFAFLNPKPLKSLGSNHAMRLQIPQEWENKMRYEEMLRKRARDNERREKARREAADRMARELEKQGVTKATANKNDGNEAAAKPNPPVNHFMVFKGFMKSPSGKVLAYLGKEDVQGDVTKRQGTEFLAKGKKINGYNVLDIDDEWVQLEDPKGREVMIIRGQRFSYGITENPDYVLEAEEEETDDDGEAKTSKKKSSGKKAKGGKKTPSGKNPKGGNKKTGGNKKAGENKTPGGNKTPNKLIQDYLKKSGGKVNQKDLNKLIKQNKLNPADLMKLLDRK